MFRVRVRVRVRFLICFVFRVSVSVHVGDWVQVKVRVYFRFRLSFSVRVPFTVRIPTKGPEQGTAGTAWILPLLEAKASSAQRDLVHSWWCSWVSAGGVLAGALGLVNTGQVF